MRVWLILLLTSVTVWAQPFQTLQEGVEYRKVQLKTQQGSCSMHQLRFRPQKARLKVLTAEPAAFIGQFMKDCFFAVNASYFDQERRPLGYLKDGKVFNSSVATGGAFGGIFVVDSAETARLLTPSTFPPHQRARARLALQAGPRLVVRGERVSGIHATKAAARTGVAVDRAGRITVFAMGHGEGVGLEKLPYLLVRPVEQGGLGAWDALNLDGGSSTQMVLSHPKAKAAIPALVPVPVGLGVVKR